MKRIISIFLLLGVFPTPVFSEVLRDVTDEDVDRAMAGIKRHLWSMQKPDGRWYGNGRLSEGSETAIVLYALLDSGESRNNAEIKKGLKYLVDVKTNNLYVIAVRTMVLSRVVTGVKDSPYLARLEQDVEWLTRNPKRAKKWNGWAWGYSGPECDGDNSCSQFALLALWEADRAGIIKTRIKQHLIRNVEKTWLKRQRDDGGWTYSGQKSVNTPSTVSMTTAGIASLFVCQDVLANTCRPYQHSKKLDKAWAFLGKKLKKDFIKNGYLAFCVQRVGMASGAKFIGDMDWFAVGAAKLAEPNPRGRWFRSKWGSLVRSSFELLFLARGRIPLTFNKLAHGRENSWNFHTRDVPHFAEYMRRKFERPMRWQVVRITDDVRLMLDGPLLLITGTDALEFTPEQWKKLREYSLRGGTLLFVPCHESAAFLKSAKEGLGKLYAEQRKTAAGHYGLETLPADHPLYSVHYKIDTGPKSAMMWGVSDGTRLLAVISKRDFPCAWHRQLKTSGRLDRMLGVNFFLYATGANSLRMRMRPVFVSKGGEVRYHAKIAWLKHGGNSQTQPYSLNYLSEKLTAENRVAIDVTAGAPICAEKLRGHHLAWMTGSEKFSLTADELSALRDYLNSGGTLFVNAVGGSRPFNRSATDMLAKLLAGTSAVSGNVTPTSPLVTGRCGDFRGPPLKSLPRTQVWRKAKKQAPSPLRVFIWNKRVVVIYAPYGVHDTLDGHTAHGAFSYMPQAARDIAANIVLYSLIEKPAPPPLKKVEKPTTTTAPAEKQKGMFD